MAGPSSARGKSLQIYTKEERARRDATRWTLVQGVLAPIQFLVFIVSLILVLRYLWTGQGYGAATVSILLKTGVLYAIMVTGSIWEKVVFGKWLFARPFFWEDVFSFVVIALHTLYIWGLLVANWPADQLMVVALAAYAAYIINAGEVLASGTPDDIVKNEQVRRVYLGEHFRM